MDAIHERAAVSDEWGTRSPAPSSSPAWRPRAARTNDLDALAALDVRGDGLHGHKQILEARARPM
jgi:hypothetical protein